MKSRTYQIKEVADIAGVSARTLRHYDEIGLLTPSDRSAAGYRLYTDADLLRLQSILVGRSLGLALEDIRRSIDDAALDRAALLRQQRETLVAKAKMTADMIRSIDAAISLLEPPDKQEMPTMDMKAIFDGFDPAEFEREVRQRWGDSDAYGESTRRTRRYSESDWRRIKDESNSILHDAVLLLDAGAAPDSEPAKDVAERYRRWVDRWFYPCNRTLHAGLAEMYEGDPRFTKYFEDRAAGLAAFLSAAMRANSA
jgi:DNA-binding transcriptional MerR regulator